MADGNEDDSLKEDEKLVFSDAHLHLPPSGSFEDYMKESQEFQVLTLSLCGTNDTDWVKIAEITPLPKFGMFVFKSFGLHPYCVHERRSDWLDQLKYFLGRFNDAGVGEIGLDFRDAIVASKEDQIRAFSEQLQLAIELNRPVTIHCVKAHAILLDLLKSHPSLPPIILHSWTGSSELVAPFSKLGCYFSISGLVCNPKAKKLQLSIPKIPLSQLLLETDSPDQPIPTGPTPNNSTIIPQIAQTIANLKSTTISAIAACSTTNLHSIYNRT